VSNLLDGFELFDGGDRTTQSDLFISIHHGRCFQVSKALMNIFDLTAQTYYALLYFNKKMGSVGIKFLTTPPSSLNVRKVNVRSALNPKGKRVYSGAAFDHVTFCKFYKIPKENQTKLPVTVDRKNKVIVAKLRLKTDPQLVAAPVQLVPAQKKSMTGGSVRDLSRQQPPRQMLFAEVAKILKKTTSPMTMKEVSLLLYNSSVISSMEQLVLNRVSEVLGTLVKRKRLTYQAVHGLRHYKWVK
jgi:hypothetical protein